MEVTMSEEDKLLGKHIDKEGGQTIIDAVGMLMLAMTQGPKAPAFREDAAKVIWAWSRGELLPRSETPTLAWLFDQIVPPPPPPGGEKKAA
jgi:hypothetical protein